MGFADQIITIKKEGCIMSKRLPIVLLVLALVFSSISVFAVEDISESKAESSISLNKTKATLYPKCAAKYSRLALVPTLQNISGTVKYKSNNKAIATVNSSGIVTAKAEGKTSIIAYVKYAGNTYKAKCTVTVKKPVIQTNKTTYSVKVGKRTKISYALTPNGKPTFTSKNKAIATVSKNGVITGIAKGTTKIAIKCNGVTKTVTVKVKGASSSSVPTPLPTASPTPAPTRKPTPVPTNTPVPVPTRKPTPVPTNTPTPVPTRKPTPVPTKTPTSVPTKTPTPTPAATRKPIIKQHPLSVTADDGDEVIFFVKASGVNLSYQWEWCYDQSSWSNTGERGSKTDTLYINADYAVRNGIYYRCKVYNNVGVVYSEAAKLTILRRPVPEKPVIVQHPSDLTVREGEKARFSVKASGENLFYQWQWRSDVRDWSDAGEIGATSETIYVDSEYNKKNGLYFRCRVYNNAGSVYSNAAKLTILPAYNPEKPVIVQQPSDITVNEGETIKFSVKASGENLFYQWQWRSDVRDWSDAGEIGATSETIYVDSNYKTKNGLYFRCRVYNSAGSVYSNAVRLTIIPKVDSEIPVIVQHPSDLTVYEGETVKFSVKATGKNLFYQWQWRSDIRDWSDAGEIGATSETLYVDSDYSKKNGLYFRCRVYNSAGSVYSNAARLTIIP